MPDQEPQGRRKGVVETRVGEEERIKGIRVGSVAVGTVAEARGVKLSSGGAGQEKEDWS